MAEISKRVQQAGLEAYYEHITESDPRVTLERAIEAAVREFVQEQREPAETGSRTTDRPDS